MHLRNQLELDFIFLECDQAIYTKVFQLLFKLKTEDPDTYNKITLRMGGFHIELCMLKTIYSRFKGCIFVELLSELGGLGTYNKSDERW